MAARESDHFISWSIMITDAYSPGIVHFSHQPDLTLKTASVGKILLLIAAAEQISTGHLSTGERIRRIESDAVADSGIWYRLAAQEFSVGDLCELIGSVSDNLATNVLLRRIGLTAVADTTARLGLVQSGLLDRVRDRRETWHPPTLSRGNAAELADVMARLAKGEVFSRQVSELVLRWLSNGLDLSQVAAPWGLDPLSHAEPEDGYQLHHKTGTDHGIRADIGILRGPAATIAYSVIANWSQSQAKSTVLARQADLGRQIWTMAGNMAHAFSAPELTPVVPGP